MEEEKKFSIINDECLDGEGCYLEAHQIQIPIHSQVVKIKKEIEKIKHPSLQEPEMRRALVLRACTRLQHTRSPLGLPDPPISVGN